MASVLVEKKIAVKFRLLMNPESAVPEGAFAGVPRLRYVSVESGVRLVGPEAWHSCRQLRIVKAAVHSCWHLCTNRFSSCTKFGHYLFRGRINLAEFSLRESSFLSEMCRTALALGCLSSTEMPH